MTRQRFNGLRLEAMRRLYTNAGRKFDGNNIRSLNSCVINWKEVKSYDDAWEKFRPIRNLVGM